MDGTIHISTAYQDRKSPNQSNIKNTAYSILSPVSSPQVSSDYKVGGRDNSSVINKNFDNSFSANQRMVMHNNSISINDSDMNGISSDYTKSQIKLNGSMKLPDNHRPLVASNT